ncbi:hypothetical protein NQ315_007050 [Exocentrus adspersus]|uniref:Elastin n=1 Tax=Exocentrus adspersus TaxID=1586481 RepID=A0AAV8WD71_9CUCU|nr:hypothetical protein NQ315_007050 [Exocentrus adspersus]
MNALAVAVLLVAVAYTSASGIGLGGAILAGPAGIVAPGLGVASARGALEGALGGQWIPDVPVGPGAVLAGPAGIVAPGLGLGLGLGGLGVPGAGLVASRGALEGALGGQWIPDTHGK